MMGKLISTTYNDKSVLFRKQEIMDNYEQDWDDENIYYKVELNGYITKVHLITGDVFKYSLE